jgi:hypothetical protein
MIVLQEEFEKMLFPVSSERNGTMNTFWLKIAGAAVGVVVILVVVGHFFSGDDQPTPQKERRSITDTKSFASQVEEDREKFSSEPQPVDTPVQEPVVQTPAQPAVPAPAPEARPKPNIIYVKPMKDFEEVEAQRLWQMAVPGRSIGRLPMTGYSLAIKGYKEITQRYPDSKYAFMVTRLVADIPERRRAGIRDEDIKRQLNHFYQKRPGTQPMTIEPMD